MRLFKILRNSGLIIAGLIASIAVPMMSSPGFAASEIKVIVNRQAITSYDIQRRSAFLRLQRQTGNTAQKAREQLIDEALKMQEARRLRLVASDAEVEASFLRFAGNNKMTKAQLTDLLSRAGVTAAHFKDYIRAQMSWPRVVRARYGGGGQMSNQDLVSKMLENGGDKPSTTEYILQQVIFVVPASKRSNNVVRVRKAEAEKLRARFGGCDSTRELAKGLRDVSVRDLGRILEPALPTDWKPLIERIRSGEATSTRITERGVEFIAICSTKTVSDDVAAEMVFRAENDTTSNSDNSKEFLEELRARSAIVNR